MPRKKKKVETTTTIEKPKRVLREDEVRREFKTYFVKLKRNLKLNAELENIIWLHLKSTGCDKPELFDKGVENFGYKL